MNLLPIIGVDDASTGSICEKYINKMQIMTQLTPFNKIFSPAVGGNQKLTSTMKMTKIAGVTTIHLYILEALSIVR